MQINNDYLDSIGVKAETEEQKQNALVVILEIFQDRLGTKITELLNDEQIDEFSKVNATGDSQQSLEWISANVPQYEQIGDSLLKELQEELKETHLRLLGY